MTKPTEPKAAATLQIQSVDDLLLMQGYEAVEEGVKARIAVGGASAVAGMIAARRGSIFDTDPSTYLSELDALAGPDEP